MFIDIKRSVTTHIEGTLGPQPLSLASEVGLPRDAFFVWEPSHVFLNLLPSLFKDIINPQLSDTWPRFHCLDVGALYKLRDDGLLLLPVVIKVDITQALCQGVTFWYPKARPYPQFTS